MTIVGESYILVGGMLAGGYFLKKKLEHSKDNPQVKVGVNRAIVVFTITASILVGIAFMNHLHSIWFWFWS